MADRLRLPIPGALNDLKVFCRGVDTLMMAAVDEHMGTVEGMEKTAGLVVGGMEGISLRMLMEVPVGDMADGTAKVEVDQLHPLTDAKDRLVHFVKQVERIELFQIKEII